MGSSSNKSVKRAQEAEDKRRADIEATQQRINDIFGSPTREGQIQDFIGATRESGQRDLARTHEDVARNLKFALARSGNVGGSTQIDQNKNLADSLFRATLDSERRALGAGSKLRSADQQAKLSLFSQALGGLDMTTAAQNAGDALSQNINAAKNENSEQNFDSFFKNFATFYSDRKEAEGRRQSQRDWNTLYAPRQTGAYNTGGYG